MVHPYTFSENVARKMVLESLGLLLICKRFGILVLGYHHFKLTTNAAVNSIMHAAN